MSQQIREKVLKAVKFYALAWNVVLAFNVLGWIIAVHQSLVPVGSWALREPAWILAFEFVSTLLTLTVDIYLFIEYAVTLVRGKT